MAEQTKPKTSAFGHATLAIAAAYVSHEYGPVFEGRVLNPVPTAAAFVCAVNGVMVTSVACRKLAARIDYILSVKPVGYKGSASWGKWRDIRHVCGSFGFGPYWGVYAGKGRKNNTPIFTDFSSCAVIFGTAGSGKGVGSVLPNILSIYNSKLIPDFKSTIGPMVKEALEARGEIVRSLNLGGLHEDQLGPTESYNLLQPTIDNFTRTGGLADVDSDIEELCLQLLPEKEGSQSDDAFWQDGSRECKGMAFLQTILVEGEEAIIGKAKTLLGNRQDFLKEMQWAAGRLEDADGNLLPAMPIEQSPWVSLHDPAEVEQFIKIYRSRASEMVDLLLSNDQGNMAQSFLKGAQRVLKPFSPTSRAAKTLGKSTFRFSDMKSGDRPVNVVISLDASRMGQYAKIAAALQWAAMTELKRAENKHVPIYLIGDEATNSRIADLPALMTWAREFNIRISLYVQSLGAWRTTYGKESLNTLLSETEIKLFLPQQRDPEMLELIERYLGSTPYVGRSNSGQFHGYTMQGANLSEDARPLMNQDEIRRCEHSILFVRNNKPIKVNLPSIASIHPWRKQVGINPFFGKPYLKPITLRIGKRLPPIWLRIKFKIKRTLRALNPLRGQGK